MPFRSETRRGPFEKNNDKITNYHHDGVYVRLDSISACDLCSPINSQAACEDTCVNWLRHICYLQLPLQAQLLSLAVDMWGRERKPRTKSNVFVELKKSITSFLTSPTWIQWLSLLKMSAEVSFP